MPRKMKRPSSPSPSCREIKKAKAASSSIDNNNDDVELSPDSEATEAPTTAHPIDTPMLTQPTAIEDPTMSSVVPSIPPVLVGPAALNHPPPVVQPTVVYDINVIVEVTG